jgi:uncharacterized protein
MKMLRNIKKNSKNYFSEKAYSLETKLTSLKQEQAYPFPVYRLETIETHMSWIFLVNDLAYKLKKCTPDTFQGSAALGSRYVREVDEMVLNKRLAEDIYLDVVPLTIDSNAGFKVEGKGEIIDWLLKMKRIPEEEMLDFAIKHKLLNIPLIVPVANLLMNFYKRAVPVEMNALQYKEKLNSEIEIIYNGLSNPLFRLSKSTIHQINETLVGFLKNNDVLFDKRITEGRIIEAHGDLRPEHIRLGNHPAIIDCLEFDKDLRILDSAEELSFLDMECENLGDSAIGKVFFNLYKEQTGQLIPGTLILFYKAKRAFLRTYLVIRHVAEKQYMDDPKWYKKAIGYLYLAEKYCDQLKINTRSKLNIL